MRDARDEIVDLLIDEIPKKLPGLNNLLIQAVRFNNRQLIPKIIGMGANPEVGFNESIRVENLELLRYIVENYKVDPWALRHGLKRAVKTGNRDVINYVLEIWANDYIMGVEADNFEPIHYKHG